jgi:hypothetical protein
VQFRFWIFILKYPIKDIHTSIKLCKELDFLVFIDIFFEEKSIDNSILRLNFSMELSETRVQNSKLVLLKFSHNPKNTNTKA